MPTIKRGDGATYGYNQALSDAYANMKPFVTDSAHKAGGVGFGDYRMGGEPMKTYSRAGGIKAIADQQVKDNAEKAAQAATPIFTTKDEVADAVNKGILTEEAATKILKSKFGMRD